MNKFAGSRGNCAEGATQSREVPSTSFLEHELFRRVDSIRSAQGRVLERLGFGPSEREVETLFIGEGWRLRSYQAPGDEKALGLLIVASPIKRSYIWDLSESASMIRFFLAGGFRVHLMDWTTSDVDGKGGLRFYAVEAIGEAVARVTAKDGGMAPVLVGHSLGGILAAIFAARGGDRAKGLVLLSAPLCFEPGASAFWDWFRTWAPRAPKCGTVPGSLISTLSVMASPASLVGAVAVDGALSVEDVVLKCGQSEAAMVHGMLERWLLDEVPVSCALCNDLLDLVRGNLFCEGKLRVDGMRVGPGKLRLPTLMVTSQDDAVAPPVTVDPFIDKMNPRAEHFRFRREVGTAFPHLAILVGLRARAEVWPEIKEWMLKLA